MHTLQVRLYDKALYDMPKASQFFIASRLLRHSASVYQTIGKGNSGRRGYRVCAAKETIGRLKANR